MPDREPSAPSPSVLPIPFDGRPSFEAFRGAQWLYLRGRFGFVFFLWAIAAAAIVVEVVRQLRAGPLDVAPVLWIALFAAPGFWLLLEVSIRTAWKRMKTAREAVQGALFDDHFESRTAVGSTNLPWSYFQSWQASERVLLLYQHDNAFSLVGRDLFAADDDWRRALALVAQKLPSRRRSKLRRGWWQFLFWMGLFAAIVLWMNL